MSEQAKLLPCPFCGRTDVWVLRDEYDNLYVYCNFCDGRGPRTFESKEIAVECWNQRAQPEQR